MIGIPATPERDQKVKQAAFARLPEMRRQLKQLQRTVAALVGRLEELEQPRGGEDRHAA
jgi:UDP-3-O-[3-hydroxymyristoyl] glucosamine N-acyltransferase